MRMLAKTSILLALILCAGCAKPSDAVSVARRDHVLAGPHGWIDITLRAPVAASAASAASAAVAGKPAASAARLSHDCGIVLAVDGETMLLESGDLARASAANNPLGYRFVVPAGTLETRLVIMGCVKPDIEQLLSVTMQKDHVASLEFDGRQLTLKADEPYSPASLDELRTQSSALHSDVEGLNVTMFSLTRLVHLSVLLNVIVLAILVLAGIVVAIRRRRR